MKTEKQQRQTYRDGWRMFWPACLGHHCLGVLSGFLAATGDVVGISAGLAILYLYERYQGLSWNRKKDSAGLDTADALYGFLPSVTVLYLAYPEGFPFAEYVRQLIELVL